MEFVFVPNARFVYRRFSKLKTIGYQTDRNYVQQNQLVILDMQSSQNSWNSQSTYGVVGRWSLVWFSELSSIWSKFIRIKEACSIIFLYWKRFFVLELYFNLLSCKRGKHIPKSSKRKKSKATVVNRCLNPKKSI